MTPAHDPWDGVDFCRDESCTQLELHPKHVVAALKGRTPKGCPGCLRSLVCADGRIASRCAACGWSRDGAPVSADPWVACPACKGTAEGPEANRGCRWCAFTGYVPRLRAARVAAVTC